MFYSSSIYLFMWQYELEFFLKNIAWEGKGIAHSRKLWYDGEKIKYLQRCLFGFLVQFFFLNIWTKTKNLKMKNWRQKWCWIKCHCVGFFFVCFVFLRLFHIAHPHANNQQSHSEVYSLATTQERCNISPQIKPTQIRHIKRCIMLYILYTVSAFIDSYEF